VHGGAAALDAAPFWDGRAPLKRSVSVGGHPNSGARNSRNTVLPDPQ